MPVKMSINQSSARRRLVFDDDDSDQNNEGDNGHSAVNHEIQNQNAANTFNEHMAQQREEMKIKYNFDFQTEQPLEGDYLWERVESSSQQTPTLSATAVEATVTIERQCIENNQVEAMDCDLVTSSSITTTTTEKSMILEDQTTPRKSTTNGTHD